MRRTQISGLLKNEDYRLPHLLKMKIAFSKLLKTEDLKTLCKNVMKMKTMSWAGSPNSAFIFKAPTEQWPNLRNGLFLNIYAGMDSKNRALLKYLPIRYYS